MKFIVFENQVYASTVQVKKKRMLVYDVLFDSDLLCFIKICLFPHEGGRDDLPCLCLDL